MINKNNVQDNLRESMKGYPPFLKDYYFNTQESIDKNIKRFYNSFSISSQGIVFEGGCGKISELRRNNSQIGTIIGMDLSEEALELNKDIDIKIVGSVESIPFENNKFDLVDLPNIVEHLENPDKVFKEINRILKKDGILLFGTKNILNPFMAINLLIPLKVRFWIKKHILKTIGYYQDTFPVYYKCNSPKKIKKDLEKLGFKLEEMWLWGWPLMKSPAVALFLSMLFEKLTDIGFFKILKPNIWVRFRKIN